MRDFAELARPGYRIVDVALPGESAEDEFQAAEFKKSRGRQGADHVTAAAHADHQGARRGADKSSKDDEVGCIRKRSLTQGVRVLRQFVPRFCYRELARSHFGR